MVALVMAGVTETAMAGEATNEVATDRATSIALAREGEAAAATAIALEGEAANEVATEDAMEGEAANEVATENAMAREVARSREGALGRRQHRPASSSFVVSPVVHYRGLGNEKKNSNRCRRT
jgi:hypothetical protein